VKKALSLVAHALRHPAHFKQLNYEARKQATSKENPWKKENNKQAYPGLIA